MPEASLRSVEAALVRDVPLPEGPTRTELGAVALRCLIARLLNEADGEAGVAGAHDAGAEALLAARVRAACFAATVDPEAGLCW